VTADTEEDSMLVMGCKLRNTKENYL